MVRRSIKVSHHGGHDGHNGNFITLFWWKLNVSLKRAGQNRGE